MRTDVGKTVPLAVNVVARQSLGSWPLPAISTVALLVSVFFSVLAYQAAAGLGWLSAIGRRSERVRGTGGLWRAQPGLWLPLLLYFGVSTLSAALGVSITAGARQLGKELLAVGCAVAGAQVVGRADARRAVVAFLVTAAAAGLWSVYQVVVIFGGTIDFAHRAYGFWHSVAYISYGNVMAMAFALAVGVASCQGSPLARLAVVAGAATTVGMVSSYTRSSFLAAAGVLGAVGVYRRSVSIIAGLTLLTVAVIAVPARDDSRQFAARVRSSFDPAAAANLDRVARYRVGAAVIRDHPVLGTGPGGLKVVYPSYAVPGAMDNWHLHNTFLQLLAERGPLGLAAWLAMMVWGLVRVCGLVKASDREVRGYAVGIGLLLVTVLTVSVFNYVWEDWRVRALTLAFLGLAWSPALGAAPAGDGRRQGGP